MLSPCVFLWFHKSDVPHRYLHWHWTGITVAALHNFPGGVIVHDDIQLCQYLWTEEDGIGVKLNDFNRAEIMLWDEQAQKYCKYKNGRGHGDVSNLLILDPMLVVGVFLKHSVVSFKFCAWQWRAPEEYKDLPLDEKIDIWSLGKTVALGDQSFRCKAHKKFCLIARE
jgi:serine/threonine protein kinase